MDCNSNSSLDGGPGSPHVGLGKIKVKADSNVSVNGPGSPTHSISSITTCNDIEVSSILGLSSGNFWESLPGNLAMYGMVSNYHLRRRHSTFLLLS